MAAKQNKQSLDNRASLSKYQKPSTLSQDANPFLHLLKVTKKEKQNEKSNDFLTKLNSKSLSSNLSNNISKSAIRRRKRKLKSQLGTNIGDLLTTLPEETESVPSIQSSNPFATQFVEQKKILDHLPNPRTSLKGARKVEQLEKLRFGLILTDKSYQNSPFESLRETIKSNLERLQ